jgi:DNA polymerase II large subunit
MTYTPDYAEELQKRVQEARDIANEAKSKGGDPEPNVEIPVAEDMAERCEKLLEREYGSKIHGLAEQIRELEENDEVDGREEMSLFLAEEFAVGALSDDFDNNAERVEAAIRTSVAILTEGVVAAPIEGLGKVSVEKNDDGTDFLRVPFFGPIRSAGGTAQAVSVLVADYVRDLVDIAVFKPREEEVERYVEEIELYDSQVGMQYCPPKEKGRYIIEHVPIMVDGQPNLNAVGREVDGYRDLERIEGNAPRDGMCLVIAEGIGLKAPKLQRYANAFDLDSWNWLDKLVSGGDEDEDEDEDEDSEQTEETEQNIEIPLRADEVEVLEPAKKYMADALAGRPIFAGPSQEGGFRLRYGRSRNAGHAAVGFHPASMHLTNEFIAPSTQLKTERPGKAAGAVPVDTIEGPTVRLSNGKLTRIDDLERARKLDDQVEEIVDLGEIAVPFGEFIENNHPLAPASYTSEWWSQEFINEGGDIENVNHDEITANKAIKLTRQYDVPLHPKYTYMWHDLEVQEYAGLRAALDQAKLDEEEDIYKLSRGIADILAKLLVPHKKTSKHVELSIELYDILEQCVSNNPVEDDVLGQVNQSAPYTVRPRAMTRIGARMGRPEKAERREMHPMVNALFPIRDAGTDARRIDKAAQREENADYQIDGKGDGGEHKEKGVVDAEINYRLCPSCDNNTYKARCPECGARTQMKLVCSGCGKVDKDEEKEEGDQCKKCGNYYGKTLQRELNVNEAFRDALDNVGERTSSVGEVKGVKRLTSDTKIPEPLEKGILRAKYDISTFRDGTARYDMCDLPLTSFKPKELGVSIEKLKELGYTETVNGKPIENQDDLIELKMQDVIIASEGAEYMLDVANYIDELLVEYYEMEPYYNAEKPEDLTGELLIGMAPHTSAGVVGRFLGTTDASANYAHPFFHAAKRRNCFHPETKLTVKLNGQWERKHIDELVETYLEPDSDGYDDTYDDGTIVQEVAQIDQIEELKVPSMTDNGHRTVENVTHLSKHIAPDHMVTIKTEDGDELQLTPDHKIPVKNDSDDELMAEKKANQLEEGDLLFDYNEDKREEVKNYKEIDILEHLLRNPDEHDVDIENVMIRGMGKENIYDFLEENIEPKWDDGRFYPLKSSAEYLGLTKKNLSNYIYRDSFPVHLFMAACDGDEDAICREVPKDVELGMNSDNTTVPRIQTLDEELSCLIGYYTAEGYCRTEKDPRSENDIASVNQVDIAATESSARDFIESVLKKRFNIDDLYKNDVRLTASGRILKFFFSTVLEAGDSCYTKRVPQQILDSDKNIKSHYLSGYLSGDGGQGFEMYMEAFTASERLRDTVEDLLDDIGIVAEYEDVEPELLREKFPDFYDDDDESMSAGGYKIKIDEKQWAEFSAQTGIQLSRKNRGSKIYDTKMVTNTTNDAKNSDYVYDITVDNTHRFSASQTLSLNCDGDEDSVMLLMDGLVNFSRKYLPSQRGKNMMDAPIVMSTVLNPEEIDDEAHNVDIVEEYPLEFYKMTMHALDPDDAEIEIAEDDLENPTGFKSSIPTTDINAGPENTAYKSMDGMEDATDTQMDLAVKTRGVDESTVASMVVEKHFFPDIIGNLTAFARQEYQCAAGHMHRRAPASGKCTARDWCDASVRLTVYEGMVDKYVDAAQGLADDYELDDYTKQRLEELDERIESVFKDDKSEQTSIEDFLG